MRQAIDYRAHIARKFTDAVKRMRAVGNARDRGCSIAFFGSKEEVRLFREAVDMCFVQAELLERTAKYLEGTASS